MGDDVASGEAAAAALDGDDADVDEVAEVIPADYVLVVAAVVVVALVGVVAVVVVEVVVVASAKVVAAADHPGVDDDFVVSSEVE